MSEKPNKLIPRLFRLTEDDIAELEELVERCGYSSAASLVRHLIRSEHIRRFQNGVVVDE